MFKISEADLRMIVSAIDSAYAELEVVVMEGDVKEDVLLMLEEASSAVNACLKNGHTQ